MSSWDGVTPTVAIDNDITPTVSDKCDCGSEKIFVDADESPPITQQEIDLQFHCLESRAGDWVFCRFHGETWIRVKVR